MYYILLIIGIYTNQPIAIASVYNSEYECVVKEKEYKLIYPQNTVKCISIKKNKNNE